MARVFPGTDRIMIGNNIAGCLDPKSVTAGREPVSSCVCGSGIHFKEVAAVLQGELSGKEAFEQCKKRVPKLACKECGHHGLLHFLACGEDCRLTDTFFCPNCKRTILVMPDTQRNAEV